MACYLLIFHSIINAQTLSDERGGLIMAALRSIIFLPCGFFYLLSSFFPRQISAVADWMSTVLPHMVWP